jgi:RNA polymerase sigma factor (sigma-70 family)
MAVSPALRKDLLASIPNLRAFAVSLAGNSERADDLVQETLMKAWAKFDTFQEGTNLRAWLFTILRNEFYSQDKEPRQQSPHPTGRTAASRNGRDLWCRSHVGQRDHAHHRLTLIQGWQSQTSEKAHRRTRSVFAPGLGNGRSNLMPFSSRTARLSLPRLLKLQDIPHESIRSA